MGGAVGVARGKEDNQVGHNESNKEGNATDGRASPQGWKTAAEVIRDISESSEDFTEARKLVEASRGALGAIDEEDLLALSKLVDREKARRDARQQSKHRAAGKVVMLLKELEAKTQLPALKADSERITALVAANHPHDGADNHDLIYQGAGLEKLIADGLKLKPIFDELCQLAAECFTDKTDLECVFIDAPVKTRDRASVKVRVSLNGDVTQLRDTVRGTLNITAAPRPQTLKQVYLGLLELIKNFPSLLPGAVVWVQRFKDRYQRPLGDYRDWSLFLSVNGYLCELQVNFKAALEEKEDVAHKQYELNRMAQANLQHAAMRGDATAVRLMLQTKVDVRIVDLNGCTPLHYASAYGSVQMCADLLSARADPLALDKMGYLPIQRSLLMGHSDTAELLLAKMLTCNLADTSQPLGKALVAAWSVAPPPLKGKMAEILRKGAQMSDASHLFYALLCGQGKGFKEALAQVGQDEKAFSEIFFDSDTGMYGTIMDAAISNGAHEEVRFLLDIGERIPKALDMKYVTDWNSASMNYAKSNNGPALEALYQLANELEAEIDLEELLQVAAEHRAFSAVRSLLGIGAKISPDQPCRALEFELLKAAGRKDLQMINLILDANVDVNAAPDDDTALAVACDVGQLEVCKLLVERRADYNLSVQEELSPIMLAAVQNRLSILEHFHSLGANVIEILPKLTERLEKSGHDNPEDFSAVILIKKLSAQPKEEDEDLDILTGKLEDASGEAMQIRMERV